MYESNLRNQEINNENLKIYIKFNENKKIIY